LTRAALSTRGTGASSLSYEPCQVEKVSGDHCEPTLGLDTHLLEGVGGLRGRVRKGKLEPVVAGVDDIKRLIIRKVGGIVQQQLESVLLTGKGFEVISNARVISLAEIPEEARPPLAER
jgi:hypothetical protein